MIRLIAAALFLCAAHASPAIAFDGLFQGPWNVHVQPAGTLQGYRGRVARSGGEASVSPKLKSVIATIRARFGNGAISGIGGARRGNVAGTRMASCHNGGHAFDAHLSGAALSYVRSRSDLGVITYSGRHSHVHVSDCARERGYRGHSRS